MIYVRPKLAMGAAVLVDVVLCGSDQLGSRSVHHNAIHLGLRNHFNLLNVAGRRARSGDGRKLG